MSTYQVGSTIYGAVTVYDVDGNLADPGAVTGLWTKPDGTTTSRLREPHQPRPLAGRLRRRTRQAAGCSSCPRRGEQWRLPRTEVVDVWPTDPASSSACRTSGTS